MNLSVCPLPRYAISRILQVSIFMLTNLRSFQSTAAGLATGSNGQLLKTVLAVVCLAVLNVGFYSRPLLANDGATAPRPILPQPEAEHSPTGTAAGATPNVESKRILFDTDMDTDCDDAGALAMLHVMADRGEVTIVATLVSSQFEFAVPCVEAINRYYGRPELPIGSPKGLGPRGEGPSRYNAQIASEFPGRYTTTAAAPNAVTVARRSLVNQPDHSVCVVTVGNLTNLRDLLASPSDDLSPLSGKELVAQKVKSWVCMGGRYPSHRDPHVYGNFKPDPESTVIAVRDWPTEIVFSGLGEEIATGTRLRQLPETNPVRRIYELYLGRRATRPSWDQVALLYAVRPTLACWKLRAEGHNHIFPNGTNEWREQPNAENQVLLLFQPDVAQEVTQIIDELMATPPASKQL